MELMTMTLQDRCVGFHGSGSTPRINLESSSHLCILLVSVEDWEAACPVLSSPSDKLGSLAAGVVELLSSVGKTQVSIPANLSDQH